MRIGYLLSLLIALLAIGCIRQGHTEPPYPKDVQGWKEYIEKGIKIRGGFVLKKGETTDNKKIQVKVIDFLPPDTWAEAGSYNALARVKLEFIRLVDGEILCVDILGETASGNFTSDCGKNLSEFGIRGFGIRAINLKEGWVYFELYG